MLSSGKTLIVLDRVRDPGNLGLILRTAEAAGSGGIFLLNGSVELYNAKVVRATMGSIFRLPTFFEEDPEQLIPDLKSAGVPIIAAAMDAPAFANVGIPSPCAYLLGNEAFGVDPTLIALADQTISIPMADPVNSLNVAIATAILLYHAS